MINFIYKEKQSAMFAVSHFRVHSQSTPYDLSTLTKSLKLDSQVEETGIRKWKSACNQTYKLHLHFLKRT